MLRLKEVLELLASASALMAVLGYISFRSHLNYLGVPTTLPVGAERYLMETAALVSMLVPVLFAVISVGVLVVFGARVAGTNPLVLVERRENWLYTALVAVAFALYFYVLTGLSRAAGATEVIVGRLGGDLAREDLSGTFYLVAVYCVVAFAICWSQLANGKTARLRMWRGFLLLVIVLSLHLPLIYGPSVRSTSYPVTEVTTSEPSRSLCGVLLLENEAEVQLWHAVGGVGTIERIRRERLTTMASGASQDVVALARDAGRNGTTLPDCRGVANQ